jgi:hypothetical protein
VTAPDQRGGGIFGAIQPMRIRLLDFTIKAGNGAGVVAAGAANRAEQPVKAHGRKPIDRARLPILRAGAFVDQRHRRVGLASRHVDHRHFKTRVGELGMQRQHPLERAKPRLAPERMAQSIVMAPVVGFQCHRLLSLAAGLIELERRGQQK